MRQINCSTHWKFCHLQQAIAGIGANEIATNQIEVHPFLQNRKLVEFAQQQGENLQSNLLAAKIKLSDEEMKAIAGLEKGERIANPGFAPVWD